MGRQLAVHFVQINKPLRKSKDEVIADILAQDKEEARPKREWRKKFNAWWDQKVETASRARHKRRMVKRGTVERHGPGVCTLTLEEWQGIQKRYQYRCAYCQQRRPLTKDHIVPISKGGFHTMVNVIPACRSCNSSKGNRPAHLYKPILIPW